MALLHKQNDNISENSALTFEFSNIVCRLVFHARIPASVDATMATWGGSTVDNLENITEDEDGQERSDRVNGNEDEEDDGENLTIAHLLA